MGAFCSGAAHAGQDLVAEGGSQRAQMGLMAGLWASQHYLSLKTGVRHSCTLPRRGGVARIHQRATPNSTARIAVYGIR